jgi:hypothetical protein
MRVDDLMAFATERHRVYLRRAEGGPPPYTDDKILRKFRFCNIYRELDTVTRWLAESWREPHADDPDLWFAFVVARHMNNIPFLEGMGGPPLPWEPERFKRYAEGRRVRGEQTFGAAYMIGTRHVGSKADYLADMVFTPLWEQRARIRPQPGDTLNSFHMMLGQFYGLASFMSAQVVADIKYTEPLLSAADWSSFAASGPGSRRGLNRVLGRPLKQAWIEDEWRLRLADLRSELLPRFLELEWELPHAQDVQNMLCEFDKMERARLGEGRLKQLFRGALLAPGAQV